MTKIIDIAGKPYLYFLANRDITNLNDELSYDYLDRDYETILRFPWLAQKSEQRFFVEEALKRGISQPGAAETQGSETQGFHRISQKFN